MANPWTKNKPALPKVVEDANFPSLQNVLAVVAVAATSSYALAATTTTTKSNTSTNSFFNKNNSDKEENNDLKPGWVYISWANKNGAQAPTNNAQMLTNGAQAPTNNAQMLTNGAQALPNGAQAPYTYNYGPDVFNAYLEDCFVREERSDYIWRRRVWRHHNKINQENATLGDLSPYWGIKV